MKVNSELYNYTTSMQFNHLFNAQNLSAPIYVTLFNAINTTITQTHFKPFLIFMVNRCNKDRLQLQHTIHS